MEDAPMHWAILIGNDFYEDEPLHGCVNDIKLFKQYLEGEKSPVNIDVLIASAPEPTTASSRPVEEPTQWPTAHNVALNIKRVTKQANPGDYVYIHYSGHGVINPGDAEVFNSNKNTGDVALVLFDKDLRCCYLEGQELAFLLKDMADKGLFVTLVLDCCFSGGFVRKTLRREPGIRSVPYDYAFRTTHKEGQTSNSKLETTRYLRDTQMRPQLLVNPQNYTVFSACGPHENAKQITLFNGKKYGALTYFLVFSLYQLRKVETVITHDSLYRQLCINFHIYWPRQTPMRYGESNLSFFGKLQSGLNSKFFPVFVAQNDDVLQIGAGSVHGVCKGDEYAVYPFNSREDSFGVTVPEFTAKVDTTRTLTSDLVPTKPVSSIRSANTPRKAKLIKSLSSWKVLVCISVDPVYIGSWLEAAESRRYLSISIDSTEDKDPLFNVNINETNEYQILNQSKKVIGSLPTVRTESDGALTRVMDILEHIATFKYFASIDNRVRSTSFEQSFSIRIHNKNRRELATQGVIDVGENDDLCLTIENLGTDTIYLSVFDLGPSWQIENLLSQLGGGGFKVVPPKGIICTGREEIKWSMSVPDSFKTREMFQCDDILKVFVTRRPSSFSPLLLPRIPTTTSSCHPPSRGTRSPLTRFLSGLSGRNRGEGEILDEEWSTQNFIIRTTAKAC